MNEQKVISLGEKIIMQDVGWFDGLFSWAALGFLLLAIIGFFVMVIGVESGMLMVLFGAGMVVVFGGMSISAIVSPHLLAAEAYEEEVEAWKNLVAIPYIESLPDEKNEIVDIKIESEATEKVSGSFYHGYGDISSETKHFTPITVTYKDDKFITETFWHKKSMSFTDEEKPFMTYKKVTTDLGHGINAGIYSAEVFLPEDYEFSKIN